MYKGHNHNHNTNNNNAKRIFSLAVASLVGVFLILQTPKLQEMKRQVSYYYQNNHDILDTTITTSTGTGTGSTSDSTTTTTRKNGLEPLQTSHVRYLLGIFSSEGALEQERRDTIRSTYLTAFLVGNTNSSATICSLYQLQEDYHRLPQYRQWQDCQLVYTFVVAGGNAEENAPTERLYSNASKHSQPMTLSRHVNITTANNNYNDLTVLNIRENVNQGKSQTWLYYGATLGPQLSIDYIVKANSDTMIFPACFLQQMTQQFGLTSKVTTSSRVHVPTTKRKRNTTFSVMNTTTTNNYNTTPSVYAGFPVDPQCSPAQYPFHQGHFYFVSTDLALEIASDRCDRNHLTFTKDRIDTIPSQGCDEQQTLFTKAPEGSEDMSMGNFVAECHDHQQRPLRFLDLGIGGGPAVAHSSSLETSEEAPQAEAAAARLEEPYHYRHYYHLRNLMVRSEYLGDDGTNNEPPHLKTAICHHNSLFSIPDSSRSVIDENNNTTGNHHLYDVMEWAIYHRLLGFDHVFLTYLDQAQNLPGFDELARLPYVTLQPNKKGKVTLATHDDPQWQIVNGTYTLAGSKCDSTCVIQQCLETTTEEGYDWVWLADTNEYLWLNQTVPVHEFLAHHVGSDQYNYLSFAKYRYSSNFRKQQPSTWSTQESPLQPPSTSGFMAEEYPFTTRTPYCNKQTASGEIPNPCPNWQGQAKVMVRPHLYKDKDGLDKIQIHGNDFVETDEGQFRSSDPRVQHLPPDLAHMKQWVSTTSQRHPSTSLLLGPQATSLVLPFNHTEVPFLRGSNSGNGNISTGNNHTATLTLYLDEGLKDWFQFVATRGGPSDVCSSLFPRPSLL